MFYWWRWLPRWHECGCLNSEYSAVNENKNDRLYIQAARRGGNTIYFNRRNVAYPEGHLYPGAVIMSMRNFRLGMNRKNMEIRNLAFSWFDKRTGVTLKRHASISRNWLKLDTCLWRKRWGFSEKMGLTGNHSSIEKAILPSLYLFRRISTTRSYNFMSFETPKEDA